ncbi:cellulose binding domain-containing protein [Motilibacter deserti]|uniref:CBM2 domain-containing protein n=1 Tax=Motilibacter deserti TaxID=2714956 RepID=A0ABX0GZL4_9ACTN|nr:cellulose binding domain-containing protein [Motilibacter deserti]NHC15020.1 hypothetical protein [Motilibacter deserti]
MQARRLAGAAGAATLAVAMAAGAGTPAFAAKSPTTDVATSCAVVVKASGVTKDATSGTVRFYNTGDKPVKWQLNWDVAQGEAVGDLWNGRDEKQTWFQHGSTLVVFGQTWNRTIQPGKSLTLGYVVSGKAAPANVRMNGIACGAPSADVLRAAKKADKEQARAVERQLKSEAKAAAKAAKDAAKAAEKAAKAESKA